MKYLSSFTHSHVVLNLYEKEDILKNFGNQTASVPTDLYCMGKKNNNQQQWAIFQNVFF